jgi:hypothetical protein
MRTVLARSNLQGAATVTLICSLGLAASAQASKASLREMVDELCGQQLATVEGVIGPAPSYWQADAFTAERPEWMSPASARIRLWTSSAFALLEPISNAAVVGRSPEIRVEVVRHLRAGLALSRCLTPTDDHWRGAEFPDDDAFIAEDQTFFKEMRATECFLRHSEDLLAVLASDLEGAALQDAIEGQAQLRTKPCETED